MELLMSFFILLVIGTLCLFFKSTRLIGVTGLTLLFLVFPFAFIALCMTACAFIYFNHVFKRRKLNVYKQNYLIDALDTVLAWDLSDESLADALANQAMLVSGNHSEDSMQDYAASY